MTNDRMDDDRDLGTQGTADSLKGNIKEATGKAQEGLGKVTGNRDMEAEGKDKQLEGNVQQGMGKVERKTDDILDS